MPLAPSSNPPAPMPSTAAVVSSPASDQPGVTAGLIEALIARQRASGAAAVLCAWEGRRSPPALLHRDLWPAIEALSGDVGAREILAGRDDVAIVEVTPALGSLEDVDTRDDHVRLVPPRT